MNKIITLLILLFTVNLFGQTNQELLSHYKKYHEQMKSQGDTQGIINALIGEINQLADAVGLARPRPAAGYPVNANDAADNPLVGGRRKRKKGKKTRRKKKKHKGGFKYTRIANSRRSLRMTRRKSLRHKTHHKKRKRTKKHRGRKRR